MAQPGQIPRRPLGMTGLELSVVGFGGSPLGSVFEDIDEAEGVRSVHEAFKLGINYFDVSPFYGLTKAETVLGRALKDLPRDQYVLSSKVGRYSADEFDFSASRVTRSVDESCARLNVDYIDIIICHDIEFVNLKQIVEETLPALHKLKSQGKIKAVGISGLPLKIFPWILNNAAPNTIDVVLSYCHYCLCDTSLASLFDMCESKGVGLINASPLSMGLLTPQGPPAWHPAPEKLKEACASAATHFKRKPTDLPTLALKFATENPRITSTLVGMCTCKQVHQNIQAVTSLEGSDYQQSLSEAEAIFAQCKGMIWSSGLPENN